LRAHVRENLTFRLQGATLNALNNVAAHMCLGLFGILHQKLLVKKKLYLLSVCARVNDRAAQGVWKAYSSIMLLGAADGILPLFLFSFSIVCENTGPVTAMLSGVKTNAR